MRQGLPGTRPRRGAQLARDVAGALSVRDVESIGGAGYAGVAAGTTRLQRGMGRITAHNQMIIEPKREQPYNEYMIVTP